MRRGLPWPGQKKWPPNPKPVFTVALPPPNNVSDSFNDVFFAVFGWVNFSHFSQDNTWPDLTKAISDLCHCPSWILYLKHRFGFLVHYSDTTCMQELTSPTIQSYHSTCSFIRKLYLTLVFDQLNRHSTDPFNCQTGVFMNYCFPSLFSFHQMQIIKHPNCMWVGKYKILCKPPIHAQRVFFWRPLIFRDPACTAYWINFCSALHCIGGEW